MPKRRLKDKCFCGLRVWQYGAKGKAYCEAHARWKNVQVELLQHPLDAAHSYTIMPSVIDEAIKTITNTIKRIGYAEAFWVAEHLRFDWGVQWWNEKVVIHLTELQLLAFAAAMKAHRETVYPKRAGKHGKKD